MKEDYKKWYSLTLGTEIEMMVYGHFGKPVIIFPTTMGRYFESKDFNLIESARHLFDKGKVKIYCVVSMDRHSWYNKEIHAAGRVKNQMWYDENLSEEVVDGIRHNCGIDWVAVAGASFGGFHAANFAFKHPEKVSHLLSMSGAFDIRDFLYGHYDDNAYFNNPIDYLPGNNNAELWKINNTLGYGEWDICKDAHLQLSHILNQKGISHGLDERRWAEHDWPFWRMMFPNYLSQL